MDQITKILIYSGLIMISIGIIWNLFGPFNLTKLPGDITIEKENFKLKFPITTSIIISVILTLIIWLIRALK